MALRIRRGTDAERQTITPAVGELIYTTDTKLVYVGDGLTVGGTLVSGDVSDDATPQLGGNLDLNGNDIIGTGNIDIDGTITATGNINLGDGAEDNVIVGGQIASSLTPKQDRSYDIGSSVARWRNGWYESINVDGEIESAIISVDKIVSQDSTVVYDRNSNTISVQRVEASIVDGDLQGSVFGDDSTLIVDGAGQGRVLAPLHADVVADNGDTIIDSATKDLNVANIVLDSGGTVTGDRLTVGTTQQLSYKLTAPDSNTWVTYAQYHNDQDSHSLAFVRTRGSIFAPTTVVDEDRIINIALAPYDGSTYQQGGAITGVARVDGGNLTTEWYHSTRNSSGSVVVSMEVASDKIAFTAPPKMPVFANDTARDAAITAPEAGMIIFNSRDDSTGVPQFQGYDGNAWVDLH